MIAAGERRQIQFQARRANEIFLADRILIRRKLSPPAKSDPRYASAYHPLDAETGKNFPPP